MHTRDRQAEMKRKLERSTTMYSNFKRLLLLRFDSRFSFETISIETLRDNKKEAILRPKAKVSAIYSRLTDINSTRNTFTVRLALSHTHTNRRCKSEN